MLVVEFSKQFPMSLSSHLDMVRAITRAINRAEIDIEYSKGFNPHKEMYFTPPLPLGVNSTSEYMTLFTSLSAREFLERYNKCAVSGLQAISAMAVDKNPNVAGILAAADYEINVADGTKFVKIIDKIIKSSEFSIEFENKEGKIERKDVRVKILKAVNDGNVLKLMLTAGNDNMRADRLYRALCDLAGTEYFVGDITRTELYCMNNGVYQKYSEIF